jgi:hypothetical protein
MAYYQIELSGKTNPKKFIKTINEGLGMSYREGLEIIEKINKQKGKYTLVAGADKETADKIVLLLQKTGVDCAIKESSVTNFSILKPIMNPLYEKNPPKIHQFSTICFLFFTFATLVMVQQWVPLYLTKIHGTIISLRPLNPEKQKDAHGYAYTIRDTKGDLVEWYSQPTEEILPPLPMNATIQKDWFSTEIKVNGAVIKKKSSIWFFVWFGALLLYVFSIKKRTDFTKRFANIVPTNGYTLRTCDPISFYALLLFIISSPLLFLASLWTNNLSLLKLGFFLLLLSAGTLEVASIETKDKSIEFKKLTILLVLSSTLGFITLLAFPSLFFKVYF